MSSRSSKAVEPSAKAVKETDTEPGTPEVNSKTSAKKLVIFPQENHCPDSTVYITGLGSFYSHTEVANVASWIGPIIYANRLYDYCIITFASRSCAENAEKLLAGLLMKAFLTEEPVEVRITDRYPSIKKKIMNFFNSYF